MADTSTNPTTAPRVTGRLFPGDQPNTTDRRIAITHTFSLRLPSAEVEAIQQKHLVECGKLGCTVLTTRLNRSNEGWAGGQTSLRIAPEAYPAFAAAITAPPAFVASHSEMAEDKSLPILDIEKRMDVKTALRDRLTAMLNDPGPKTTADVVAIEKELTQVLGDIEAATAQRDYLRTLTDTVRVDISYGGQPALVGGLDFSPITRAISGTGQTLVTSVASLVSFLAFVLPWLPVIAFAVWIVRFSLRRWKAQKQTA